MAAGRGVVIDVRGRNETWVVDTALRVAAELRISSIHFRNLPDQGEKYEAYVEARAAEHGVSITGDDAASGTAPEILDARRAREAGHRYLQIQIPLMNTTRGSVVGVETKTHRAGGIGWILTQIETEGWELFDSGFVFWETGQVSRDKFLTSGQSTSTTGQTIGIYLFRAASS